ncbi:MAG: hypothetical protein ACLFTT_15235, partial [Candidatus Hydrogenedentota bacterium]
FLLHFFTNSAVVQKLHPKFLAICHAPFSVLHNRAGIGRGERFRHEGGAKFLNRDLLTPDSTRTLEPGSMVPITMPIGLPPADEEKATLVVVAAGLQAADALSVRVNDTGPNVATAGDETLRCAIPAGTLVKGANTVTFSLEGNHDEALMLRDLWVHMP